MCMGAEKIRELMLAAHKRQLTSGNYMFFNVDLFNASSYGKVNVILTSSTDVSFSIICLVSSAANCSDPVYLLKD